MGLKQDIVVKAYFTNKFNKGYGKTPGNFVVDYIARDGATENLSPITTEEKQHLQDYIERYNARIDVTEQAMSDYDSKEHLSQELSKMDDLDGRSFGNQGISYSKTQLLSQAGRIQKLYDEGHTVEKLVISFTQDYAKRQRILDQNFNHTLKGDFAGQVDQLKLRHAINDGMFELATRGDYQNPIWAGAIQVDTNHLHAHVVLVDDIEFQKSHRLGRFGNPMIEERGKLSPYEKDGAREGIDHTLLSHRPLRHFHTQVALDHEDETTNLQNLVQYQFGDNTQIQLILASLPRNQDLWDADSDEPIMRRPNELMDSYLNTLTEKYDSQLGFTDTLEHLKQDAHRRSQEDDHSDLLFKPYYEHGVKTLRTNMKNQIYAQLQSVIDSNPSMLSTAFLTQNARDPEALKSQIQYAFQHPNEVKDLNMTLFAYRLTSYRQRLSNHTNENEVYHNDRTQFDKQALNSHISNDAYAIRHFYKTEELFHAQAMDKYRFFFKVDGHNDEQLIDHYQNEIDLLNSQRTELLRQGQRDGLWSVDLDSGMTRQQYRQYMGNQLVNDNRIGSVLMRSIDDATGADDDNIGKSILKSMREPTYQMPSSVINTLDELGEALPEYANAGSSLGAPMRRKNARPSFALQVGLSQYAMDADDLSYRMFRDGVYRADQLQDGFEIIQNFGQNQDIANIPALSEPNPRQQGLTRQYFDSVKGIDLDDLGYDFGPNTSRQVGVKARDTYYNVTEHRYHATQAALGFLNSTNQTAAADTFTDLFESLERHRKLSDVVNLTHQLDTGFDELEDTGFDQERQFKSVDLQQANRLTRNQLSLIRDVDMRLQAGLQSPTPSAPKIGKSKSSSSSRQSPA